MGLLDSLLGRFRTSRSAVPGSAPELDGGESQVELVAAMAQRMVDVVNESMQIANGSKNVETRRSRIRVARDRLADLQKLDSDYSFLALTNLADVERSIAELERETEEMAPTRRRAAPKSGASSTVMASAGQRRAGMHGLLPANFDVTCDCGREFGVPLSDLEGDFACPGCGKIGRFTAEQVAAIHAVAKGADDKVLGSLGALMDRPQSETWKIGNPGARHPYAIGTDHPASRYCAGMRFSATFQTRTPLRILRRHGQVLPIGADLPDDFEPWMGMWVPQAKSSAMREAAGEKCDREIASSAGPVKPSEYLPFLVAVREAVENEAASISDRMAGLQAVCFRPAFGRFVAAEHSAAAMCDRYFPPILSLIRGLPMTSKQALEGLGIRTVRALRRMSDGELLAIKGIGPGKLVAIREFCAVYEGDPDAERCVQLAL